MKNKTCRICSAIHSRRSGNYCGPICKNLGNFGDAALRNAIAIPNPTEAQAKSVQVYLQSIAQSGTRAVWDAHRTASDPAPAPAPEPGRHEAMKEAGIARRADIARVRKAMQAEREERDDRAAMIPHPGFDANGDVYRR